VVIGPTKRKLTAIAFVSALEQVAEATGKQDELKALKKAIKKANPEIAEEIGW
jgi:ribosomal protein S7